jgi:8-hydroxy-5-deazaflavin:NADPH oxidoreductase
VKVFNNITAQHLAGPARPAGTADRSTLSVAGNDPATKQAVMRFVDAIGYDSIDAGTLRSGGHRFEFGTRAWVAPNGSFSDPRVPRPA